MLRAQSVVDLEFISEWYYTMQAENSLDTVLYNARMPELQDWIDTVANTFIVDIHGKAIAWFVPEDNGFSAWSHFCISRLYANETETLGNEAIAFLGEHTTIKVLFGLTPKPFRHVLSAIKMWNYSQIADVPSACYLAKHNKRVSGIVSMRII